MFPLLVSCGSEQELESNPRDTWRRCFHDFAESHVIDIAIHRAVPVKLRVVEGIESLEAEFERFVGDSGGSL
jgi:hypothetical protein